MTGIDPLIASNLLRGLALLTPPSLHYRHNELEAMVTKIGV